VLLFKYLSDEGATRVLESHTNVSLKFSLPSAYNDPYELFLQPDHPLRAEEHRAFYEYFLGEVVEFPVTCFSIIPNSVVMWAHYGREGTGICLGFDEDTLTDQFPVAYVQNVSYSDKPAQIEAFGLEYAATTGKRRHLLRLLNIAYNKTYFMKRAEWQYELERRLVVSHSDVKVLPSAQGYIASLPASVLRYVIVGAKTEPAVCKRFRLCAEQYGVPFLQFNVGKKSYEPFFFSCLTGAFFWDKSDFAKYDNVCSKCAEPAQVDDDGLCCWCDISDEARATAPRRSMLYTSLALGIEDLNITFNDMRPKGWMAKKQAAEFDRVDGNGT
jgi:hypothetical protein